MFLVTFTDDIEAGNMHPPSNEVNARVNRFQVDLQRHDWSAAIIALRDAARYHVTLDVCPRATSAAEMNTALDDLASRWPELRDAMRGITYTQPADAPPPLHPREPRRPRRIVATIPERP
jgi:hypothetical protein